AVAATHNARVAWMKAEGDKLTGSIERFFPDALKAKLKERLAVEPGDLLLFVADCEPVVSAALGALRIYLANKLGLVANSKEYRFAWVVDFPMFTWDEEEKRWAANHHPFTAPRDEDLHL